MRMNLFVPDATFNNSSGDGSVVAPERGAGVPVDLPVSRRVMSFIRNRCELLAVGKGAPGGRYLPMVLALALSPPACGQTATNAPVARPPLDLEAHPGWQGAGSSDTSSIETLIGAFARVVWSPAGGTLDRDRLRRLFTPSGHIVVAVPPAPGRTADVVILSPDGYADLSDRTTARQGFFDHVISNRVERFGVMAHVYSAYGSRHAASDPEPFARGVKSFELLNSGDRWYIVQVYYDRERAGNAIPKEFLTEADIQPTRNGN